MTKKKPGYKSGYFKVSDGHKLFYELYGNPRGIPLVVLHGGPGGGCGEHYKKLYDARVWNVLFFDQRGAYRSKPFCSLKANTTDKLVTDVCKLMDHVGFTQAVISGFSWGSTLALTFAIKHTQRVMGLHVGGIFTGTRRAINFYMGGGARATHPECWERFVSQVPPRYQKNPAVYYLRKLRHGSKAEKKHFAYEWFHYEMSIIKLEVKPSFIAKRLREGSFESIAAVEAHYMVNDCFLPPNFILKHAHTLSHIPTTITHGRYDAICSYKEAYDLHRKIAGSRLQTVPEGHSADPVKKVLKSELRWLRKQIG